MALSFPNSIGCGHYAVIHLGVIQNYVEWKYDRRYRVLVIQTIPKTHTDMKHDHCYVEVALRNSENFFIFDHHIKEHATIFNYSGGILKINILTTLLKIDTKQSENPFFDKWNKINILFNQNKRTI
ncbi:hypothetical protein ACQVPW_11380 [Bacillus cereus]|uniref:hypothetical protein n=1 Tax=Bacillus cereus TaxID=1396 RepID=UPI003D653897